MPPTVAPTSKGETRRLEILRAAALTLVDRGYGDTRIAEVAERANVSTALLIYYFGTREQMLLESLKLSESSFYSQAEAKMRSASTAIDRLDLLVEICCVEDDEGKTLRGLWFELWSQAQRHADVAEARAVHDGQWRDLITHVVREGQFNGEVNPSVDARRFAVALAALLDGLSVQVGLADNEVTPDYARRLAMDFITDQLGVTRKGTSEKRG
jgi:AcrR family transcriptional regulator